MSTRRLRQAVLVRDEHGDFHHFGTQDRLPDWAATALKDADVWDTTSSEAAPAPEKPEQPAQVEPAAQEVPASEDPEEDLLGEAPATVPEQPHGNGSLEDWRQYALAKGATAEDLQDKSRNEIRAAYGD